MAWLTRLLNFDPPESGRLHSAELLFRDGSHVGWLFPAIIAAFVTAVLLYRSQLSRWRGKTGLLLISMRGATLSLLLILTTRPYLVAEFRCERSRPVALLIDNSASMRQVDPRNSAVERARVTVARGDLPPDADPNAPEWQSVGREGMELPSRMDVVRSVLANARLDLLARMEQVGPVHPYLFGSRCQRITAGVLLPALTADQDRSAVADAVAELIEGSDDELPAAIVLVTDGLDNASRVPLADVAVECRRRGVSVHVYGVGSTDWGGIRMIDAGLPDTVFYDDVVSIPVSWRARAGGRGTAEAIVSLGGRELARQEFDLAGQRSGRTIVKFVPERKQALPATGDLVVGVRMKGEPAFADELRRRVEFSDRRVRVLVVDEVPRWEFKFLQPALSRDRRVEAHFLLAQGDPRAMTSPPFISSYPPRDKLFDYDLVILGDVAPDFLGPDGLQNTADFVREGGGLAVIAGRRHMPAAYAETPLAEVMPVEFAPVRFSSPDDGLPSEFRPTPTLAGRRSQLLQLTDSRAENDKLWAGLPGFFWHYPVSRIRSGAMVLVERPPRQSDEPPSPLIVSQHYGKGEALFIGSDETWRWRFNTGDRLYSRFWGQVAYQLGLPHLLGYGRRAQLSLDAEPTVGRPGYVYARVLDGEYRPYVGESITAELERASEPGRERHVTPIRLLPVPGSAGEFRVLLPHDSPGNYTVTIQKPVEAKLPFRVRLPAGHESEPDGLAELPLRELAEATGGAFYREEDLHRLPDALPRATAPYVARQEAPVWGPLPWLALVMLITAEWILRKLVNLS